MKAAILSVLSIFFFSCLAQRSPYAGKSPIGYPLITPTSTEAVLANRFGDGDDAIPTTTMKLPVQALGDAELVRRLMQLPLDRRPFWLINWQALQDNRNNPQTYRQKDNGFVDRRS